MNETVKKVLTLVVTILMFVGSVYGLNVDYSFLFDTETDTPVVETTTEIATESEEPTPTEESTLAEEETAAPAPVEETTEPQTEEETTAPVAEETPEA